MDYSKIKLTPVNWKREFHKYSEVVRNRWKYIDYLDRKLYKTNYPIRYYIDYKNKNEYIDIPANYEFDFNSAPTWWHIIVDRDEFMIWLVHDRLFDKNAKVIIEDIENLSDRFLKLCKYGFDFKFQDWQWEFLYNRKFADKIWYYWAKEEAREIERVNKDWKAFFWYLAIRIWWAKHFRKN